MKRLLILGTILMMTATAFAFGGGGSGRKSTAFTSGVDAVGVHFNGKGQANVDYTGGSADTPVNNILGRACANNADPVYRAYPIGVCCSPSGGWFCPEDEVPSSDCTPDPSCSLDEETCLAQGGKYDSMSDRSICCLSGDAICAAGACTCAENGWDVVCGAYEGCYICAADAVVGLGGDYKCYPKNVAVLCNGWEECYVCPVGQSIKADDYMEHYICYNPETEEAECPYDGECVKAPKGTAIACGDGWCHACAEGLSAYKVDGNGHDYICYNPETEDAKCPEYYGGECAKALKGTAIVCGMTSCHACAKGLSGITDEYGDHYICYDPETEHAQCPWYGECAKAPKGTAIACGDGWCHACTDGLSAWARAAEGENYICYDPETEHAECSQQGECAKAPKGTTIVCARNFCHVCAEGLSGITDQLGENYICYNPETEHAECAGGIGKCAKAPKGTGIACTNSWCEACTDGLSAYNMNDEHYICYNPETEHAECSQYGACISCTDGKTAVCGSETCVCCSGDYHYNVSEPVCD